MSICGSELTYVLPGYDWHRMWRCELPQGHEGPHQGENSITPISWANV